MHGGKFRGHTTTKRSVVPKTLRLNTADRSLTLLDEFFELIVGPHIERLKSLEELLQVANGRITKDLWLAIVVTGKSLAQMGHERRKLFNECLLSERDSFLETGCNPPSFFFVQLGAELL